MDSQFSLDPLLQKLYLFAVLLSTACYVQWTDGSANSRCQLCDVLFVVLQEFTWFLGLVLRWLNQLVRSLSTHQRIQVALRLKVGNRSPSLMWISCWNSHYGWSPLLPPRLSWAIVKHLLSFGECQILSRHCSHTTDCLHLPWSLPTPAHHGHISISQIIEQKWIMDW